MTARGTVVLAAMLVCLGGLAFAQDEEVPLSNWSAPATWTPAKGMSASAMADLGNPVPFIPITPCRVADTRGNGFTGQYGPPALAASGTRSFTITGQCGIPTSSEAVSFNFTVVGGTASGDLRFYPAGSAMPLVSTINWSAGQGALANAAVVPLGGGAITVKNDSAGSVHLIIDVNGYYTQYPNTNKYFGIVGSEDNGGLIYGSNYSTMGGSTSGVRGQAFGGAGASGVLGEYFGSAAGYGVEGTNSGIDNDAAGVIGRMTGAVAFQGAGNTGGPVAGVRGESNVAGVLGIANLRGVQGMSYTAAGDLGGWGVLGMISASATYGVRGVAGTSGTTNWGVYSVGNMGASGTKPFVEPHPTEAGTVIRYVALEGPEAGTYFRGRGRFDGRTATIEVPESFRLVTDTDGLSIQVTPIGGFASVYVEYIGLDQIVVRSTKDVEFFFTVNGVRHTFKNWQVTVASGEYMPDSETATMPEALSPEQKRYLIQNGTYHEDGTVNLETAERLGWVQQWRDQEAKMKAVAEAAAAKQMAGSTIAERNMRQP